MAGKVISVSSVKGGVGKTTTVLNLAGIYSLMEKKVLIIDMDLYSGGVAVSLDVKNKKDVFMLVDSMSNNRFTAFKDYVATYNKFIDILACPRDPREAMKIESRFIPMIFDIAKRDYDVVLVDTHHVLDEINLVIMDYSYMTLFVLNNDLVDFKNMKSLLSIFKDNDKKNFLTLLNNSRDTGKDYMSMYDIRNMIGGNIDYTISRGFHIKNIDKYVIDGEILTLNKNINNFHSGDIAHMKKMALDLIDASHEKEGR